MHFECCYSTGDLQSFYLVDFIKSTAYTTDPLWALVSVIDSTHFALEYPAGSIRYPGFFLAIFDVGGFIGFLTIPI